MITDYRAYRTALTAAAAIISDELTSLVASDTRVIGVSIEPRPLSDRWNVCVTLRTPKGETLRDCYHVGARGELEWFALDRVSDRTTR